MRARSIIAWIVLFLTVSLGACIPTTTATIQLGNNYSSTEIDQIDALLEKLGFSRSWFIASNGDSEAHIERERKLISAFHTEAPRGFGASVVWARDGGALIVAFTEYNTRFSQTGKQRLHVLIDALRQIYGDRVVVID